MSNRTLDYGRSTHVDWRRIARRSSAVFACLLVVGFALYGLYRWRYYRALRQVEAGLAAVRNITNAVYGHDDDEDFNYRVDAVVINAGGDPGKRIVLYGVGDKSFTGTTYLDVAQVGPLESEWTSYEFVGRNGFLADADGYCVRGGSTGLDIGTGSRFASILPLPRPVRTERDLFVQIEVLQRGTLDPLNERDPGLWNQGRSEPIFGRFGRVDS